jgi:hypothetical protein
VVSVFLALQFSKLRILPDFCAFFLQVPVMSAPSFDDIANDTMVVADIEDGTFDE